MSRGQQTWIIVAALFLSVATLVYFFAPRSPTQVQAAIPAEKAVARPPVTKSPAPTPASILSPAVVEQPKAPMLDQGVGKPFTETFEDLGVTLKFVPTAKFRRLIEYREGAFTRDDDPTCSSPYSAREKVVEVKYEWGFVIDRFWTWNENEGRQEYIISESSLPRVFHGSVHDIVQDGRSVTVTKQRCGMGQVASLVAVKG